MKEGDAISSIISLVYFSFTMYFLWHIDKQLTIVTKHFMF